MYIVCEQCGYRLKVEGVTCFTCPRCGFHTCEPIVEE